MLASLIAYAAALGIAAVIPGPGVAALVCAHASLRRGRPFRSCNGVTRSVTVTLHP